MSHSNGMLFKNLALIFIYLLGTARGQFIYLNTGVFKLTIGRPMLLKTIVSLWGGNSYISVTVQNEGAISFSFRGVWGATTMNFNPLYLADGIGLPVNVEMSSGTLSWFNNFQVFYKLPDNVTYYEPYKIMHKRSVKNTLTRFTLYQAFEKYFNRLGFTGNECVHRLVCETAKRKLNREENGLLGEIADILFTPEDDGESGLGEHKAARRLGLQSGSRCGAVYKDCVVDENSIFSA